VCIAGLPSEPLNCPSTPIHLETSSGQSQCTRIPGTWKRCATKSLSWRYSLFHMFRPCLLHIASIFLIPLELTASLLLTEPCGYKLGRSLLPIASIIFNPLNGSCASIGVSRVLESREHHVRLTSRRLPDSLKIQSALRTSKCAGKFWDIKMICL
jgi:hypothetical protein